MTVLQDGDQSEFYESFPTRTATLGSGESMTLADCKPRSAAAASTSASRASDGRRDEKQADSVHHAFLVGTDAARLIQRI